MCQMTFACGNDNDFSLPRRDNNEMQTKKGRGTATHDVAREGEGGEGSLGNGTSLKAVTFAFACHICGYEIARTNFKLVSPGQGND